jgi:hypothetical protein
MSRMNDKMSDYAPLYAIIIAIAATVGGGIVGLRVVWEVTKALLR